MKDVLAAALLIAACIIIFGMIGRLVLAALHVIPQFRAFDVAIGIAVVVSLAWPLQFVGIPGRVLAAAMIICALTAAIGTGVSSRYRKFMLPAFRIDGPDVVVTVISIFASIAFFADPLREFGLTLASMGNIDPISYALDARQSLTSGYVDVGGVANRDLAYSAAWNWPGAVTLQMVVAGITQRSPGFSSMLALMMLASIGIQQTAHLVLKLVNAKSGRHTQVMIVAVIAALISTIAWLNPFGGYVIGNGFIAQLGLMALIPASITIACGISNPDGLCTSGRSRALLLALLAGAGLTIYGAVTPIVSVVVIVVTIGAWTAQRRVLVRPHVRLDSEAAAVIALFFACALGGLLWFSYNGILITTSSTAGWTIEAPRVSTLFGLTELFSQTWGQAPNGLLDLFLLGVVFAVLMLNFRFRDHPSYVRLLIGLCFGLFSIAGMVAFGAESYKAWKLLGTCTPFAIAAVGATLLASALHLRRAHVRLVLLSIMAVAVLIVASNGARLAAREWTTSPYSYGATLDLTTLQSDPTLRSLDGVNVKGGSLPATMLMLLYVPTPNRVAISDSFYPAMKPVYRFTVEEASLEVTDTPRMTVLNGSYDLVDTD